MGRIKDENFYQIQGWMLNRLNLKGIDLQIFAIIYGFSQDDETEFTGSIGYLSEFTGASRPTVIKSLKKLCENQYIMKKENKINGVCFNTYKTLQGVKNFNGGSKETLLGGSKETLPNNNILNNNKYIKESKQEKSKPQNSFDEIFKGYTQNEETLRGDKNVQNRGDKNVPHNNTSINNTNINNNIPVFFEKEKQADELFERLWKEYPNKKGKADVHKTNKLELLKFGYEKLSRAIKNYDKSVTDKKFLMYGSRFFKTGFLDYLETKEETSYSSIRRL